MLLRNNKIWSNTNIIEPPSNCTRWEMLFWIQMQNYNIAINLYVSLVLKNPSGPFYQSLIVTNFVLYCCDSLRESDLFLQCIVVFRSRLIGLKFFLLQKNMEYITDVAVWSLFQAFELYKRIARLFLGIVLPIVKIIADKDFKELGWNTKGEHWLRCL